MSDEMELSTANWRLCVIWGCAMRDGVCVNCGAHTPIPGSEQ